MPINTGGLAGLVDALRGGMDPSQAFGIVQYLEQEQQDRMAQRAGRLGGLADLLTQAASGGMPYGGAEALAEVAPGPSGPAVENMLSALYPTAEPQQDMSRGEMIMGGGAPSPEAALSPTFVPPTPETMGPLEQQTFAMNEMQMSQMAQEQQDQVNAQAATEASILAGVRVAATQAKQTGKTPAEFIRDVMAIPDNALALSQNEAAVGDILREVWASPEVAASPWHSALGQ